MILYEKSCFLMSFININFWQLVQLEVSRQESDQFKYPKDGWSLFKRGAGISTQYTHFSNWDIVRLVQKMEVVKSA